MVCVYLFAVTARDRAEIKMPLGTQTRVGPWIRWGGRIPQRKEALEGNTYPAFLGLWTRPVLAPSGRNQQYVEGPRAKFGF